MKIFKGNSRSATTVVILPMSKLLMRHVQSNHLPSATSAMFLLMILLSVPLMRYAQSNYLMSATIVMFLPLLRLISRSCKRNGRMSCPSCELLPYLRHRTECRFLYKLRRMVRCPAHVHNLWCCPAPVFRWLGMR